MKQNKKDDLKKPRLSTILASSFSFIVLMAIVSMFSDMTHEGANSVTGAFEDLLGAPDIAIAVIGGLATLVGSSLRILTGYLADKTKRYWTFTIIGYLIDLIAVPMLALVPNDRTIGWVLAMAFVLLEKVGKSIKKPAKDALVSFAASENGIGKSFAFGEALDQIGAFLGPMILTITYLFTGNFDEYHRFIFGFAALGIPAVVCFSLLLFSWRKFKHPETFEKDKGTPDIKLGKIPSYVLFIVASCFMAFGFMDSFSLISKNLFFTHALGAGNDNFLPLLYSYAMFVDAVSALFFGFLYDKKGFKSIAIATFLTAGYSFFLFMIPGIWSTFVGLTLWGIGMGAEESVMKSGITELSGKSQRARAFGTYELFYGLASFGGSFLVGWLYGFQNKVALCVFSALTIVVSAVIYLVSDHARKTPHSSGNQTDDQLKIIDEKNAQGFKSEAMALLEECKRNGKISETDYQQAYLRINKEL